MSIISSLPYTLTNGTTADATQVMANFNQIYSNVNANAANSGVNSTITQILGLTTPLSAGQGGTGATSLYALATAMGLGTMSTQNANAVAITGGVAALTAPSLGDNSGNVPTTSFLQSFIAPQGMFKNLKGAWLSNVTASWSADQLVLQNSSGQPILLSTYSQGLNSGTSGAGGLDTGSLAASTWYYIWAIYNPSTPATSIIMSLSSTAPTLPTGYTYKARIGSVFVDSAKNMVGFVQHGRKTRYVVGNNLTVLPGMAYGTAGSYGPTSTTYSAVSITNYAPSTSASITVQIGGWNGNYNVAVSPNPSYSGGYQNTNCPLLSLDVQSNISVPIEIALESSNIYYMSNGAQNFMNCYGYEDNL